MSPACTSHYLTNDEMLADLRAFAECLLDGSGIADERIQTAWRAIVARMAATLDAQNFIPWIHVAAVFRLSAIDQQLLLLALQAELDASFAARLQEAAMPIVIEGHGQGVEPVAQGSATGVPLQTISRLLGDVRANLLPESPLQSHCLLDTADARVATMTGTCRLSSPLIGYLTALAAPRLKVGDLILPELGHDVALDDHLVEDRVKLQLKRFIDACAHHRVGSHILLLHLQGGDSTLLASLAAATFAEVGYAAFELNCRKLLRAHERWGERRSALSSNLAILCRDALLCNAVIVLTEAQALKGSGERENDDDFLDDILHTLFGTHRFVAVVNAPARVIAESTHRFCEYEVIPFSLRIEALNPELRRRAWLRHADRYGLPLSAELCDRLVDGFRFPEHRIARIVKDAAARRLLDPDHDIDTILVGACRAEAEVEQPGAARELRMPYRLSDIVAEEATFDMLSELLNHVKYRPRVVDEWGFAGKYAGSRNLSALFHGPSGTGKTMAASIVANELSMGLYRVELASVLSKYIGETEQHLGELFDRVESMNVVLFFDEAEGLFSKRTENRDAHDRHANLQVGYLLQRIETYQGLVILATNLLGNMDKAFLRRFRFVIEFPFPSVDQRKTLWAQAFPPATPIAADVNVELLAKHAALAGGSIHNVALNAAFHAAAENVPVAMRHVVKSIRGEYRKLGKVFAASDFS